jgi:hypothetical protein
MTPDNDALDARLDDLFAALRHTPERDPQAAAQGRRRYIDQIRLLQDHVSPAAGVSAGGFIRLKGWINSVKESLQSKERSPMFSTLMTILISLSLLLGGVGATAYAAQDSLPSQALYPFKILGEEINFRLTNQPQSRIDLLLAHADRRVQEMVALSQAGESIPKPTLQRWQAHTDQAFELCARSGQIETVLLQLRTHLQEQDQLLSRLQIRSGDHNEPLLARIRAMIQERFRWVDEGIQDPIQFQERFRQQSSTGPHATQTPQVGGGFGPGPLQPTQTPGTGDGYGPGPLSPSATPIQGGGYGPGPDATQTPASGDGNGHGPNATPTPETGDGYGPGPSDSTQTSGSGGGCSPSPYQATATVMDSGLGKSQATSPAEGGGGGTGRP